jgi:hypothetical protein
MPEERKLKRRYDRVPTPTGIWVAWQHNKDQDISRVRDLNVGGLFINTPSPPPEGATIQILLSIPEGEIKSEAVVRNVTPAQGMGVEFKGMSQQDADRLEKLVARLLRLKRGDGSE